MKKRKKILSFIFFILLMLSINSMSSSDTTIDSEGNVSVDDENVSYYEVFDSPLNNLTPNFQIISIVDKKVINKGEKFTISFQISGNGKVVANKLVIYFPDSLLKDNPVFMSIFKRVKIIIIQLFVQNGLIKNHILLK